MRVGYSKKVLELFLNPKNVGYMEDANVTSLTGSIACGDMLKLYLKINPETEIIEKISFESYGCAANIATSSMITEMAKGKSVKEAWAITFKEEVEELGGLPKIKYHCAVLSVKGLRLALEKWEVIQGRKTLNEDFVLELLRGIMDPHTDKDLVSAGVVKKVDVEGKRVEIVLALPEDEFKEEVLENVEEAFEKMDVELIINSIHPAKGEGSESS
ncbi:MAG: iron-sulfur cluster assembly scaffold protein [Thermoplasmata archaeon]|nr:iron-sulfur cluster assembly scaffold protein [Thermoplasmata archaeon]